MSGRLKIFALLLPAAVLMVCLQNCKPDLPLAPPDTDPDSLYVGTKYTITQPYGLPPLGNPLKDSLTVEGIELGRRLFYDKRLSSTGLISCASCHKQQFAFSDGGQAKSMNVFGPTRRNAPTIQNLLWVPQIFWDGRVTTLSAQARDASHGEMNMNVPDVITMLGTDSIYTRLFKKAYGRPGTINENRIYNALEQFMAILISADSRYDSIRRGQGQLTPAEARGLQIFLSESGDCFHCHSDGVSNTLSDNFFRNNGLDSAVSVNDFADAGLGEVTGKAEDMGKFRDVTLRNIALSGPYMHDGRFNTLEEVVEFYSTGKKISPTIDLFMLKPTHANGGLNLAPDDKVAVVEFLKTLTDYKFINNPAFSNPF